MKRSSFTAASRGPFAAVSGRGYGAPSVIEREHPRRGSRQTTWIADIGWTSDPMGADADEPVARRVRSGASREASVHLSGVLARTSSITTDQAASEPRASPARFGIRLRGGVQDHGPTPRCPGRAHSRVPSERGIESCRCFGARQDAYTPRELAFCVGSKIYADAVGRWPRATATTLFTRRRERSAEPAVEP